jgi:hypothetical protein
MTLNTEKLPQQLHNEAAGQTTDSASTEPKFVFDQNKVTVIFVLGGPGAGDSECSDITSCSVYIIL